MAMKPHEMLERHQLQKLDHTTDNMSVKQMFLMFLLVAISAGKTFETLGDCC